MEIHMVQKMWKKAMNESKLYNRTSHNSKKNTKVLHLKSKMDKIEMNESNLITWCNRKHNAAFEHKA